MVTSVDEFVGRKVYYASTVCNNAKEPCPIFPGDTRRIHCSFIDAAAEGDVAACRAVFRRVRNSLFQPLSLFVSVKQRMTNSRRRDYRHSLLGYLSVLVGMPLIFCPPVVTNHEKVL
jgi:hypothetical protein